METLFTGRPLKSTQWLTDKGNEIAYVVMEDEGSYWSILASTTYEGIQEIVDKDTRTHPNPKELANKFYEDAVKMIDSLIEYKGEYRKVDNSIIKATPL
jgi:hypothetical protein